MCVRSRPVARCAGVAGQGVRSGDQRRREARAPDLEPAGLARVGDGVVDRGAGVGVGVGGDVGDRPVAAARVDLPGRLRLVLRATGAGPAPDALALVGVVGVERQRCAADGGDVPRRCRELDAVAVVAGGDGDRDPRMVEVRTLRRASRSRTRSPPHEFEMTVAPSATASFSAAPRLANELELASTSRILQFWQIACAVSTSSAISSAQPEFAGG